MFNKRVAFAIVGILLITLIFYFYKTLTPKSILGTTSKIKNHTLVFLGDSMTEYLGNFDELRNNLNNLYPKQNFLLLNYGFGSSNILSAPDRLEKLSDHKGRGYQPINDISFDLILIESFGYNPLSSLPLEEGLKKQTEALDKIINTLLQKHPKSSIIFIATIAPNSDWFGGGVLNLLPDQKNQWVGERIAYIKNHIDYAKSSNIPLINIYEKSLNADGKGNIDYINSNDFIHPSPTGIHFISKEIAEFIKSNKLF